jgi:hypothetical protein
MMYGLLLDGPNCLSHGKIRYVSKRDHSSNFGRFRNVFRGGGEYAGDARWGARSVCSTGNTETARIDCAEKRIACASTSKRYIDACCGGTNGISNGANGVFSGPTSTASADR